MKQLIERFCVFSFLLALISLSASCYAQTTQSTPPPTETPEANQAGDAEKPQADEKCDFSGFNTLKVMPLLIKFVRPVYPKRAKRVRGTVLVRFLVNREGLVEKVCKVKGNELLAESAVKAAMGVKLEPAYTKRQLDASKRDYIEFTLAYNFNKIVSTNNSPR